MANEQILSTASADVQGYVYRNVLTGHVVVARGNSWARDALYARYGYRVVGKSFHPAIGWVTSLK